MILKAEPIINVQVLSECCIRVLEKWILLFSAHFFVLLVPLRN